eukprot:5714158-Lingulodinium_polyedra.AAC.1
MENRAKAPTVESMRMAGSSVASSHSAPVTVEDDDALAAKPDEDEFENDIVGFSFLSTPKPPPVGNAAKGGGKRQGGAPAGSGETKRRKTARGGSALPVAP